nr:MAG TPA: hypothetical protein [Caudoviricetes sp.]
MRREKRISGLNLADIITRRLLIPGPIFIMALILNGRNS